MSEIGKALGQKNGHTELAFLASKFNEVNARYRELSKAANVHAAQITLAEASGDQALVEKLKNEQPYSTTEYLAAWDGRKAAFSAFLEAAGITRVDAKGALL